MRRLTLLVSAIVLVDTMFYAAIAPLLPYYAHRLQLSKSAAGLLVAAYPAGTLVGALPGAVLGGLARALGPAPVFGAVAALAPALTRSPALPRPRRSRPGAPGRTAPGCGS